MTRSTATKLQTVTQRGAPVAVNPVSICIINCRFIKKQRLNRKEVTGYHAGTLDLLLHVTGTVLIAGDWNATRSEDGLED
ncbi:hypothetical protein HanIR_Chr11g0505161 [Helianthus annuus]|nr:hypothetical protein HanIR_Chr11g0505161 [Helianthus annuus]